MNRNLNQSIAGRRVLDIGKTGVLGSAVPSSGLDGPGYIYQEVVDNSLAASEVRGRIESTTLPAGSWFAWNDTRLQTNSVPDGVYTLTYRLYVFGVEQPTATINWTVGTAPAISVQPSNQTVTEPSTATFSLTATGTSLTYQWQRNPGGVGAWADVSGGTGGTTSSYTTPATTVTGGTANNGDQYRCVVTNGLGSITSNVVSLTVNAGAVAPSISVHPSNQTASAGATATFSVTATGTAPLTYQWQRQPQAGGGYSNIGGATSSSYTTPATTLTGGSANNGDTYRCVVSNASGSATSNVATLTVNAVAPSISVQPTNQTVTAGATATFSLTAIGTAPLTYQWQWQPLAGGGYTNVSGATSSSYTTSATTVSGGSANNGDTYRCLVTNAGGTATSNVVTLTVNAEVVAPSISSHPSNQSATAPGTATFVVSATGTAPLSYQWQRQPQAGGGYSNIGGATLASYTTPATTVTGGTANNGDQYRCVVSNSAGSATSNAATLTVNAAADPAISVHPVSQSAVETGSATFSVTATGTAPLTYQWQRLPASGGSFTNISGATSSTYSTGPVSLTGGTDNNGDQYRCVVTGPLGAIVSNAATLTVTALVVSSYPGSIRALGVRRVGVDSTGRVFLIL